MSYVASGGLQKAGKLRRVVEKIRRGIASGAWPAGAKLPAEARWHRQLGAGRQTLVRALEILAREGEVVRRRGSGTYVANRGQPPLLPGRHLRIGLLWNHTLQPKLLARSFSGLMTQGALEYLGLDGCTAVCPSAGSRRPTRAIWHGAARGVTVEAMGEAMLSSQRHPPLDAVRGGRFDALLTLGVIEDEWLAQILETGLPTVLLDYPGERLAGRTDTVFVDSLPAYRHAVRYLAGLGLRRIHFVGTLISVPAPDAELSFGALMRHHKAHKREDPDSQMRLYGWQLGMQDRGLHALPRWIHHLPHHVRYAQEKARELAAHPAQERPEAVVCSDGVQAEAIGRVFKDQGLPLVAVGACPPEYSGPVWPVRINGRELGRVGAAQALARLREPGRPVMRVGVPMRFDPPG